jgi:hypothetical protein
MTETMTKTTEHAMTVEQIETRIRQIDEKVSREVVSGEARKVVDVAVIMEQQLREDVLRAIAEGHPDSASLAAAVLRFDAMHSFRRAVSRDLP